MHSNLIAPDVFVLKTMKFAKTETRSKSKMGCKGLVEDIPYGRGVWNPSLRFLPIQTMLQFCENVDHILKHIYIEKDPGVIVNELIKHEH